MQPTDITVPDYFHKVVDCQWACPSHTPVPEYIRLIADRRYTDAWAVNWRSNVFPGILGRTCDRPCEPACRRGRVETEPVAICRLKRVAADNKGDIRPYLPQIPLEKNGRTEMLETSLPHIMDFAWSRWEANRPAGLTRERGIKASARHVAAHPFLTFLTL